MSLRVRAGHFFLSRTLPPGIIRESVMGDLDQEFEELSASGSGWTPDTWYLLEAVKIGVRFRLGRILSMAHVRGGGRKGLNGMNPFQRFGEELRWSFRRVTRAPGIAIFAAMAIGLGIGATATMFSLTHTGIQQLPYPDSEELVALYWDQPSRGLVELGLTPEEYTDWARRQQSLESLEAYAGGPMTLSGQGDFPERLNGARVTANAFRALEIQPALGRGFLKEDEAPGASGAVVLSHVLWVRRYGQDPGILGRTIRVDGVDRTVVGIMPPGFQFPRNEEIWVPFTVDVGLSEEANLRHLTTFGRLRDGNDLRTAEAEFTALARRFAAAQPSEYEGLVFRTGPYQDYMIGRDAVVILVSLLIVVSFVLVVACASVANLLLARAVRQTREIAVQVALGAGRKRIMAQVLTESLLISAVGGVVGVGLAYLGAGFLQRTMGSELPFFWMSIQVDPTVLAFVAGLAFLSAFLAGVVPGLRASHLSVAETLKDESHGSTGVRLGRWSRRLVVAEVALSCGLLTVAGLTAKDLSSFVQADRGFDSETVLTARVSLGESVYAEEADRERFARELLQDLSGKAGVAAAALTTSLPGTTASNARFQLEGVPADRNEDLPRARLRVITPGFFEVLDATPLEGRTFSDADGAEATPIAVVNRSFVNRYFPGEGPLGRRILMGDLDSGRPWRTIVGVVPDLGMNGPSRSTPEGVYVPLTQRPQLHMNVLLKAGTDPLALTSLLRGSVADVDGDLPVYDMETLDARLSRDSAGYWAIAAFLLTSGLSALLLAGVGLFGILAFSVSNRSREMGIRLALGARESSVLWMVMQSGLRQIGLGLLIGAAIGLGGALALQDMFQTTSPLDLSVLGAVAGILTIGGLLASLAPALRAMRTDPAAVLRME
jgi:predicted permease